MSEKTCAVIVNMGQESRHLACDQGSTIMEVLNRSGVSMDAPCGGKCLCGKCKVRVKGDGVSSVAKEELTLLSEKERGEGVRLACAAKVMGDIEVVLEQNRMAQIMCAAVSREVEAVPSFKKTHVVLEPPTIDDQRDDLQRLLDKLDAGKLSISLPLLSRLPYVMREQNYSVTAVYGEDAIIAVEPGDTSDSFYGIAVDIGTTTVVAYLMDMVTGRQVDVVSDLNGQKSFGSDVISRIDHVLKSREGLGELNGVIIRQLSDMIGKVLERNGIDPEHLYHIVLVGNTTMMHLAAGITPGNIAAAPFVPVATGKMSVKAAELNLAVNGHSVATLVSCASGYVGADIIGAVLASGMLESDELSLLIDIGTNGEIVLGNREGQVCCSTAAGPAFEGAHIRNGVGGIAGAINTVSVGEALEYTTLFSQAPIGICGSGIIDSIAVLVDSGIVDETGRFVDEDEVESPVGQRLYRKVIEVEGAPAMVLAEEDETSSGEVIAITQKDVREVQLAKAAIGAGINILLKHVGKEQKDIRQVYLAGGFGSYMNKKSAVTLGLLPKELENRIMVLGNAAGAGAVMCLLSDRYYRQSDEVKQTMKYLELSNNPDFQDEFVECMFFG